MPDKQDKKTKITSGAPAGQVDSGSPTKHQREANSMDPKNGDGAASAPKKKTEEKRSPGGIAGSLKFLNDVKIEAKKITWPPRSQVINETWSVIVMVAFITFMVLGFDYALGQWIFGPIEHAAKMMAPSTPDTLFQEVPATPTPGGKPIDSSTPPTGTPPAGAPGTTIPDATQPLPTPGTTTVPVTPAPGSSTEPGSTLPPAGTMPGLPAPTSPSPSAPSTVPAATTPPVTPPATTAPTAPQTPAPGATPTSTTAPQAPATPTTPHP